MREHILLYINGQQYKVSGEQAFNSLAEYLRSDRRLCGTKVVCDEGDCGACTVLVGRESTAGQLAYRPVNSCIQYMHQLDLTHVVTIEGLARDNALTPVQTAMIECQGAQCGYCTPGIVVAMTSMFEDCSSVCEKDIKDALTGNLCRCTGYEPIIKAGLSVSPEKVVPVRSLYPSEEMLRAFSANAGQPVLLRFEDRECFLAPDVKSAVAYRSKNPHCTIISGGTDVCVMYNKKHAEPQHILSLCNIRELDELTVSDSTITVGARASLSQFEECIRPLIPELYKIMWLFGSPQIRHAGTLVGNIANASPIADTLPFLFVMESEVEATGPKGSRRININELYKGYKQLDLAGDEIITRVFIPLPAKHDVLRLYKVSRRKNLDISTFTAAIKLEMIDGTIRQAKIAYGGVGPVVLRLPETERFLAGKRPELALFQQAGELAEREITPISDVRGSRQYRNQLAKNILLKFFYELKDEEAVACR